MRSMEKLNAKKLFNMWKKGDLIIPSFQRNYVWGQLDNDKEGNELQSNLIHTMLMDDAIPALLLKKVDVVISKNEETGKEKTKRVFEVMDGQQRLTTVFSYLNSGFILNSSTIPVDGALYPDVDGRWMEEVGEESEEDDNDDLPSDDYEEDEFEGETIIRIAERAFDELPEQMRDALNDYGFHCIILENITPATERRTFSRFNSGMALSEIERLRADGGLVTDYVNGISKLPFFDSGIISLSKKQFNRFVNFELIIQMAMVLDLGVCDIGSKSYREYVLKYAETGLPKELQEKIEKASEYLGEAFKEKEKFLIKSNIPVMALLALQAIEKKVIPNKFAYTMYRFFTAHYPQAYKEAVKSKTADKSQVEKRIRFLSEYFNQNIEIASTYLSPAERKAKDQENKGKGKGKGKDKDKQDNQDKKEQDSQDLPNTVNGGVAVTDKGQDTDINGEKNSPLEDKIDVA